MGSADFLRENQMKKSRSRFGSDQHEVPLEYDEQFAENNLDDFDDDLDHMPRASSMADQLDRIEEDLVAPTAEFFDTAPDTHAKGIVA